MSGRMTEAQKAAARAICAELRERPNRYGAAFVAEREPFDRMVRRAKGKWRVVGVANRLVRIVSAKERVR